MRSSSHRIVYAIEDERLIAYVVKVAESAD